MAIQIPHRNEGRASRRPPPTEWLNLIRLLTREVASFGSKGLNDARKEQLFRELNLLLRAGVDPRSVLDLLLKSQRNAPARSVMTKVRDAVMRGSLLSSAMASVGVFSSYEIQSIRIGEESGRLAEVSLQLAEHHADRIKLRRMVRQAFAYPSFVLVITVAVVLFMMNVVVPMFAQVFARSGAELPALTAIVLKASAFFRSTWPFLFLALFGIVGLVMVTKDRPTARIWRERISMRVPILGALHRKALLARHCRSMAFLLGAGSPLDRALELSEEMTESPKLRSALGTIRREVIHGRSLHLAMRDHRLFDEQMVAMIGVAEEVKQLDAMHMRLGERYTADVQHRTALLGSILEPATILVIAVLVGTVLVAMYLPMFKLSTTF